MSGLLSQSSRDTRVDIIFQWFYYLFIYSFIAFKNPQTSFSHILALKDFYFDIQIAIRTLHRESTIAVTGLKVMLTRLVTSLIAIRDTLSSNRWMQRQRFTAKHSAECLPEEREEGLYHSGRS